jgi:hypothetical protein
LENIISLSPNSFQSEEGVKGSEEEESWVAHHFPQPQRNPYVLVPT